MIELDLKKVKLEGSKGNILENIAIKLKKGDFLMVRGFTGSGKTTFLKIVAGIVPHVSKAHIEGTILFNKQIINFDKHRKKVSFSFQEPENQFLLSSVKEEIFLNLNSKERNEAIKLVNLFKMKTLMNKSLRDLSIGQKKIIAIISTLAKDREILILDEPSANLDEETTKRLNNYLSSIKKGKIIVVASHDPLMSKHANKNLDLNRFFTKIKSKSIILREKVIKKEINTLISLKEVAYTYEDGTKVFDSISFEVKTGEIVGLIGKNGSGKSTLINLINFKIAANHGKVSIDKKKKLSLIMQEPEKQLFTNSVEEEIEFGKGKNSFPKDFMKNILKLSNLNKKLKEHPYFLSRGQKQILLILSVLFSKPDILIIDEPFTGIDNKGVSIISKIFKEFNKKYGITILITDQSSERLNNLVNRLVSINSLELGKKINEGLVHEIYKLDRFVYKIAKSQFKEYHNKSHFEIERNALNLLKNYNLPTPKVKDIIPSYNSPLGRAILIEEFIDLPQKSRENLSIREKMEILNILKRGESIKLEGYGIFNSRARGENNNWEGFIRTLLKNSIYEIDSSDIFKKDFMKKIKNFIYSNMELASFREKGSFLFTDLNVGNLFFKDGKVANIIDIDHPIIGDPLFEYASLKWYHPDIFNLYLKENNIDFKTIRKIKFYEFIHALSVISWMSKNKLNYSHEVEKFFTLFANFEKDLIILGNLSLLVIKPELTDKLALIIKELKRRNYFIEKVDRLKNFKNKVIHFYRLDYSKYEVNQFKKIYAQNKFKKYFYVLIVRNKNGDTIAQLKRDVGHFKNYQTINERTLRSKFGFGEEFNFKDKKGFQVIFNGFHKVDSVEDFIKHLRILGIGLF